MEDTLFDPTAIPEVAPSMPLNMMREEAAYSALLSGSDDPVAVYKKAMVEFETESRSRIVESVRQAINKDTDETRRSIMAAIIKDQKIPKEQAKAAIQYYISNRDVYPPLKEVYAETVAATNPVQTIDADKYLNTFFTKEFAANQIQKQVDQSAAALSGSVEGAVASFSASVLPFVWGAQNIYKGYTTNQILEAVQNKDIGVMRTIWNSLWPGSNIADIRKTMEKMPIIERVEAANRAIKVIEAMDKVGGLSIAAADYDKYILLKDALDTNQVYSNWDKHADNLATLLGAAMGAWMLKGKSAIKAVPANSVLGKTAAHNPTIAARMAEAALDGTAPVEALGTDAASIIASYVPKYSDEMLTGITPEASAKIRYIDEGGVRMIEAQGDNPLLYDRQTRDSVKNRILDVIKSAKNMAIHPGKSSVQSVDELASEYDMGIKGSAVFGKDELNAFTDMDDAKKAAEGYLKKAKEGSVEIVALGNDGKLVKATGKEGEYFVRWQYDHRFNPWDAALYGKDAVKLDFTVFGARIPGVSEAANWVSKTPAGRFLFAHHAQPKAVTDTALRAFDKAVEMERPFIIGLLKHVSSQSTKVRGMLDNILKEGEEAERIFTFDDIYNKGLAANLGAKEAENLATSYIMYRRVGDWMYAALNKSVRTQDVHEGVKKIVLSPETFINGRVVSLNEVAKVRQVYNPITDSFYVLGGKDVEGVYKPAIRELEALYNKGGTLVKMKSAVREGDDVVQYAIVQPGFSVQKLDDFVLPYVKGYTPRFYDNAYFVTRTPLKATLNGLNNPEPGSAVVYAANTKKEAIEEVEKLRKKFPDAKFDWKRDRGDEESLLEEAQQFRNSTSHTRHRGEKPVDNATKLDPLLSMYNLVNSMTKYAALDEFVTATRESFTKVFDDFLIKENGIVKFPRSKKEIIKPANMSGEQGELYKQALSAYDYLESLLPLMRSDQKAYKASLKAVAEVAEKMSIPLAQALRGLSKTQHPIEQLRRLATVMYIYLRPQRQVLLQPSALALLMGQDVKYLNPVNIYKFGKQVSMLQVAGLLYKTDSGMKKLISDDAMITASAKVAGVSPKEWRNMVEDLQATGFLPSVDTQSLIEGVIGQSRVGLVETGMEKAGRLVAEYNPLAALSKAGKRVGFDVGERFNLVGSWVMARERFLKHNPGADLRSSFAKEQIAADAREMALSMNRAGSFSYQRNILAIPLQFLSVPHKAILALTTSKMWTPAEKARLAATHFALYGAYGVGLAFAINNLKDKYPDLVSEDTWEAIKGGIADVAINNAAHILLDEEGQETKLAISASMSPLSASYGIVPFAEFLSALSEKDISSVLLGPSWNLVNPEKGRIVEAYRKISALYDAQDITEDNIQKYLLLASEVTSGGTDYMKYSFAMNSGIVVSTLGQKVHDNATRAEAIGKSFGYSTQTEQDIYRRLKQFKDIDKEQEKEAEALYRVYDSVIRPNEPINEENMAMARDKVTAYLSVLKASDENKYINFLKKYRELEKRNARTLGDSVNLRIMRESIKQSDEARMRMRNLLPEELRKDLNEMTNSEDY